MYMNDETTLHMAAFVQPTEERQDAANLYINDKTALHMTAFCSTNRRKTRSSETPPPL